MSCLFNQHLTSKTSTTTSCFQGQMISRSQNITGVTSCPWAQQLTVSPSGVGYCVDWLDLLPGWRSFWHFIGFTTVTFQFMLLFWTSYILYRFWLRYKLGFVNKFFTNGVVWTLTISWLGSLFMGTAYIDPWGLSLIYSPTLYLALYAFPYGAIPASTIALNIHLFDDIVLKYRKRSISLSGGYTIFSKVCIVIILAYAAIGFPAFGWKLASVFSTDPNSHLGIVGNDLAYVMYGLVIFASLFGSVPALYVLYRHAKHEQGERRIKLDMVRQRVTSWCIYNVGICIFTLASTIQLTNNPNNSGTLLIDTFVVLGIFRAAEVLLQWNTNRLLEDPFVEPYPFYEVGKLIFGDNSNPISKDDKVTKPTKSVSMSSGNSRKRGDSEVDDPKHSGKISPKTPRKPEIV